MCGLGRRSVKSKTWVDQAREIDTRLPPKIGRIRRPAVENGTEAQAGAPVGREAALEPCEHLSEPVDALGDEVGA